MTASSVEGTAFGGTVTQPRLRLPRRALPPEKTESLRAAAHLGWQTSGNEARSRLFKLLKALLGNADAQLALAADNFYAAPERQNYQRAIFWAQRATRNGAAQAGYLLVNMLLMRDGLTEENLRRVFDVYEFMARRGDGFAQRCLGQCYENGEGVARDLEQALLWYTAAAANGQEDAIEAVGRLCGSVAPRP
jgi:TPR repeat protein